MERFIKLIKQQYSVEQHYVLNVFCEQHFICDTFTRIGQVSWLDNSPEDKLCCRMPSGAFWKMDRHSLGADSRNVSLLGEHRAPTLDRN